jgi:hypothetical protein
MAVEGARTTAPPPSSSLYSAAGNTADEFSRMEEEEDDEDSYVQRVINATLQGRDVWGEELLARPEGPTLTSMQAVRLHPLYLYETSTSLFVIDSSSSGG